MHTLLDKINRREASVAVIGLGYVGLPLAVAFTEVGFRVVGIDTDREKVSGISRGESYLMDIPSERLANIVSSQQPDSNGTSSGAVRTQTGTLRATTDYDFISEADVVVVCVPTPLSKTKDPDLSYVTAAVHEICGRLHQGMLIVMESTTFPGATEEVVLPALENATDKPAVVGKDFYLAFSPERIDPGNSTWTISSTPKVVGGITKECLEVASAFYDHIVDQVVPVSSPKAAEMVKLLENTFRATNIALVNEVAIMCNRLGVNVWEVIEAAKTKPFGFMPFYPGPGLGGHCIPVDPQYLAWKLKTLNYDARFIQLASEINFGMPGYVVGKVADSLNQREKPIKGSNILVLGVTYKADVADLRESPALDVIQLLVEKGGKVTYHDPHAPEIMTEDLIMQRIELDQQALLDSDCVVITTAHSAYDWQWIVDNSRLIVDTRNATAGTTAPPGTVVLL